MLIKNEIQNKLDFVQYNQLMAIIAESQENDAENFNNLINLLQDPSKYNVDNLDLDPLLASENNQILINACYNLASGAKVIKLLMQTDPQGDPLYPLVIADINSQNHQGFVNICDDNNIAIKDQTYISVLQLFLKHCKLAEIPIATKMLALSEICRRDTGEAAMYLLEDPEILEHVAQNNNELLHEVCLNANLDVVKMLLDIPEVIANLNTDILKTVCSFNDDYELCGDDIFDIDSDSQHSKKLEIIKILLAMENEQTFKIPSVIVTPEIMAIAANSFFYRILNFLFTIHNDQAKYLPGCSPAVLEKIYQNCADILIIQAKNFLDEVQENIEPSNYCYQYHVLIENLQEFFGKSKTYLLTSENQLILSIKVTDLLQILDQKHQAYLRAHNITLDDAQKSIQLSAKKRVRRFGKQRVLKADLAVQPEWNCFDIAVALNNYGGRASLIEYAIQHADDLAFRNLLAPEIQDAALLAKALLNTKRNNSIINSNIKGLQQTADTVKSNPEVSAIVACQIKKLKKQKRLCVEEINALPFSMYTAELCDLVNNYWQSDIKTQAKQELYNYCLSKEVYINYVKDYYGTKNWFVFKDQSSLANCNRSTAMLDIVALMLNKIIIIYQNQANNLVEIYRTKNRAEEIINIQYCGNYHFIALQILEPAAAIESHQASSAKQGYISIQHAVSVAATAEAAAAGAAAAGAATAGAATAGVATKGAVTAGAATEGAAAGVAPTAVIIEARSDCGADPIAASKRVKPNNLEPTSADPLLAPINFYRSLQAAQQPIGLGQNIAKRVVGDDPDFAVSEKSKKPRITTERQRPKVQG